ncbi:hypothetical protein CFC21_077389 [Triticum aestivum]|uniref:DUF1618 domain-containing protein n=2 Tax=Triticum aestivum TaxID=4565 RepID=A0A9R1HUM1_WHEAT|nr:hypothetical protein CFC21_077388 [Triticum aestivum]KAF7072238.1 hypothetical protein CFC21_077389 [Triticum aestivum]
MATGGAPKPEEETVVFPDWVMLERIFRKRCLDDLDAAGEAVNKNKTAAPVKIDGVHSCFVSFTLAAPPGSSYFNLHWPERQGSDRLSAFVRATDKNLVLFDISIPDRIRYMDAPPDLFVYTASAPSPSVQQLPRRSTRRFLAHQFITGILQLKAEHCYIVADLNVHPKKKGVWAELCVFNSGANDWRIITEVLADELPDLWWSDDVFAFDGRFLCWVDYFCGVVLCDFSKNVDSQVLHFVPFPGGIKYPFDARFPRYFPGRFRSASISQGMIRYIHIDNDFHETIHSDWQVMIPPKRSQRRQQQLPHKITIWTLNSKFEWEVHCKINLDCLWAQPLYRGLPRRLPEFPVISMDDPGVLCCLLRAKEFGGKERMIMVDMNHADLQSFTDVNVEDKFSNTTQLPTVFSKYLQKANRILRELLS